VKVKVVPVTGFLMRKLKFTSLPNSIEFGGWKLHAPCGWIGRIKSVVLHFRAWEILRCLMIVFAINVTLFCFVQFNILWSLNAASFQSHH
jgi:hypothetical protein